MTKKLTFSDIAKYTNFSKTTISRYFNNPDSLTLESRKKIEDALIALDYKENKVARSLANGKSEMIGIIIPDLFLHYYSQMLNCLINTYSKYNYKFLVFVENHDTNKESKYTKEMNYIKELMAYQIEGLIILSNTIDSKTLSELSIPIVSIEREDKYISSVNSDNYAGAFKATNLLIDNKCDILIHINVNVNKSAPAYDRIWAFQATCEEYHVPYDIDLSVKGASYHELLDVIREIFNKIESKYPDQKKGIFLANDTYANMFLNLIFQKYGTFPSTYEIVGFDNSPIASEAILPITTIGQQIDVIAKTAMDLLVQQMEEQKKRVPKPLGEPIHKQITPILIRRNTTE